MDKTKTEHELMLERISLATQRVKDATAQFSNLDDLQEHHIDEGLKINSLISNMQNLTDKIKNTISQTQQQPNFDVLKENREPDNQNKKNKLK